MMKYNSLPEFEREFKKLEKKYKTLTEDFERVKVNVIELNHIRGIDNKATELISNIGNTEDLQFRKIRKFACVSIPTKGNRTGLRVIYAFFPKLMEVVFLEIYIKSDKENENRKRMKEFSKQNEVS